MWCEGEEKGSADWTCLGLGVCGGGLATDQRNDMSTGVIPASKSITVRIPWVLLFLISLGGVAKQYDQYGYVSPNQAFMVLATGLYINA